VGAVIPNEDQNRLARTLDAKKRMIGIDAEALSQQVAERKEREAAEKERDAAYDQLSNYHADQVTLKQQEAEKARKAYNEQVHTYRMENQLMSTRKEWDLNRPDAKLIDRPARVGDDDARIGTASMQKFDGEDLTAGDRKAAQIEQAKGWWETQAAERAAQKAAEAEAELAHSELVRYQDAVQRDMMAQEIAIKQSIKSDQASANQQLAEEKKRREKEAKEAELAASMAEMEATLTSSWMTEDPNQAASALSAYRVRKDHFKGMSETEKKAIQATQLAQMEEGRAKRAAQAAEEARDARTQSEIQRALAAQVARVEDFKKQQAAKAAEVLKKQAEEKAQRDKDLAGLYKNQISATFFEQFGTSHR